MKQWLKYLSHNSHRKLEISTGGKWYLGFTILLGVVAINSGNNVIYLLESLLLSALLFSGILSEQTLTRIRLRKILGEARAQQSSADYYEIHNMGKIPLFCIEVGEFSDGKFHSHAFVLSLTAGEEKKIRSQQVFNERGKYEWKYLAVATSFPFGFARKIRLIEDENERIIWPAEWNTSNAYLKNNSQKNSQTEISPGEIEELEVGSDLSRVHWLSSARLQKWIALSRKAGAEESEIIFEVEPASKAMEQKISEVSSLLYYHRGAISFLLKNDDKIMRIKNRILALNTLSLLPKGGE